MEQVIGNRRGGGREGEGEAPAALWTGTRARGAQGRRTGSRSLLLAKAAIGGSAARASGIIGATVTDAAGGDMGGKQRLNGERGALVDRQRPTLEARDGGLIQPKPLAQFDLRQAKLAPDVSEVVHDGE